MNTIQYQQKPDFSKRQPVDGTFELTIRCNLHCKMCLFRHADDENETIQAEELTTSQWIDMAKQVSDAGTGSILITGGEPMIRSDFCEIWEGIYKQGFIMTLYTNASLVTPKIMETLRKYPPHKIGITLYGSNSEIYEKVCGNGKAFYKVVDGIKMLETLPSIINFRTTIIQDNYTDVENIESLVHKLSDREERVTQTRIVNKAVRGACAKAEDCRLSPENNVYLAFRRGIDLIKNYYGEEYNEQNLYIKQQEPEEMEGDSAPKVSLFGCDAGIRQYTLTWNGKLLACQMLGLFETDAIKESFLSAWNRFPSIVKLPELNEKCMACNKQNLCNCCIASRYAETLDPGGCPEYVCKDTEIVYNLMQNKNRKEEL